MARNKKLGKVVKGLVCVAGVTFAGMYLAAKKKKPDYTYKNEPAEQNPFAGKRVVFVQDDKDDENADGVRGHLEAVSVSVQQQSLYSKYGKRMLDMVLSFGGLVVLSPVYATIALAIKIEDPGPVLFTQKRVGQNKEYFKLHKFRSMKVSTPHDVPTHQLENPEQYITKVGKFIRAHSLDELPQIWDIFVGNMSIIGPRPGLWNQDLLTAERDKYGANDVKPGLTGWAQINGRDELEIPVKAKLDGEYVQKQSLLFDVKCFLGTVSKVSHDDSVVEGGTGEMKKKSYHYTDGKSDKELIGNIGFGEPVEVDPEAKKKVLITGAGSYIGQSFIQYAKNHYPDNFEIEELDMTDAAWRDKDFSEYDVVYHVAGIAHADMGNVSEEIKSKYYEVNTGLAVEAAEKAKREGVKTFIFMSSMIVYGESAPYGQEKVIDETTVPHPANFYGDSKLQADVAVRELANDTYKVIVLRPPMIYGKDSKGNYRTLAKLAKKLPIFPDVDNERSMLYIENLCEFLCQVMLLKPYHRNSVVLLPQNGEWTKTSDMVKAIAKASGKKITQLRCLASAVWIGSKMPGKIGGLANKAFGNNCYGHQVSEYAGIRYQKVGIKESIVGMKNKDKHILVISQYFYPEQFRINDICTEWVKRGYRVTVVTGIPNYPQGEFYEGYDYEHHRAECWNGIEIIRLPIRPRKKGTINLALNYMSFVKEGKRWIKSTNIEAKEVFIYEVSPMTQALVGVWYAQKMHISCNLYVTDLWPENVEIVLGVHNKLLLAPIEKMVEYIYKRCDHIFTSSQSFIEKIAVRGVRREKLIYWPQYAEEFYKKEETAEKLEIPNDGITNLTFAGNIGTAQGLDILVKVASLLKKKNILVRFNMIGNGRYEKELRLQIQEKKVENYFNFIGQQPAEKIPKYFAWSDAALITLSKSEVYAMTIPAKTQSCLACGIPVIVSADGEVQNIIREAKCGLHSNSGDVVALTENIMKFIAMPKAEREKMSNNALNYYSKNFEKKMLMDKMEAYI